MRKVDLTTKEWILIRLDPAKPRGYEHHTDEENAQCVTLPEAQRLQLERDPEWRLLHFHTFVGPNEHELWLNGAGATWSLTGGS